MEVQVKAWVGQSVHALPPELVKVADGQLPRHFPLYSLVRNSL